MPKKRRYYKGKRISKGELEIAKFLEANNIPFERERSFDDCKSPKNRPLRFDFYLPEQNLLIEYQGQHHFGPVNPYRRAKIVHEKTKKHDLIKKEFIKEKNILLIEIVYTDYKKIKDILSTQLIIKGV